MKQADNTCAVAAVTLVGGGVGGATGVIGASNVGASGAAALLLVPELLLLVLVLLLLLFVPARCGHMYWELSVRVHIRMCQLWEENPMLTTQTINLGAHHFIERARESLPRKIW